MNRRRSHFKTADTDELCERLGKLFHRRMERTDHGVFHFSMESTQLEIVNVARIQSSGLKIRDEAGPELYVLVRLDQGTWELEKDKARFSLVPGQGILVPPGGSAYGRFARDFATTCITIPAKLVTDVAYSLTGERPRESLGPIYFPHLRMSYIDDQINSILDHMGRDDEAYARMQHQRLKRQMELIEMLIQHADSNYYPLLRDRFGGPDRRYIDPVIALMEKHPKGEITLKDMAEAAGGVTERTVRNAFQRQFHKSPSKVYLELRLRGAQSMLQQPEARTTVETVREQFGFERSGGHFADQYRRLFGETPEETLRRARKKFFIVGRAG